MTNALAKLTCDQVIILIAANASAIAKELQDTKEAKLNLGIAMKLSLVNGRLYCASAISYARKFKDDTEGSIELEKQLL